MVSIPNSVSLIDSKAFNGCTSLTSLIVEDGEATLQMGYNYSKYGQLKGKGLFYDCPLETLYLGRTLSYETGQSYGFSPFYGKESLKEVTISNSVTSIEKNIFRSCSTLTSVEIPNSVTSIGNTVFSGCKALTNIIIKDGESTLSVGYDDTAIINSTGCGLFYDCPLETLYLGRTLSYETGQSYGFSPFYGKESLKEVTIGNSVTKIGDYAFYGCSGLTGSLTIPNSVTSIGNYSFNGCKAIASLIIEDGETPLSLGYKGTGQGLFYDCQLETLHLGRNLSYYSYKDYGYSPFYEKKSLKEVTIGNSVTSIGGSAFSGCSGLTSVEIPNSVTSIGNCAFNGCNALTNLIIEDCETTLSLGYNDTGKGLFYDCPLETLHLGRNLSYETGKDYGYSPFYGKSSLKELTIGNTVTSIGERAFNGCSGLSGSLTIPTSVTSIGQYVFDGCSGLTSVEFSNSVTSIGGSAFNGCSGLKEVHISDIDAWCKIDFGSTTSNPLFYAHSLFLNGNEVKEITIPNSVTSIGNYAFYGCDNIYQILSEAVTPPEISDDSFSAEVYDNALVMIPSGTLKSYQSKWSKFKHLLEGEPVEQSYEITQAGTLMNKLNLSEVNNITSLKLYGPLNGTDLLTLNKMPNIQTLDLSEATIVSGGMNYYEEDNVKYGTQDNTLGNFWAYALDCLTEVKLPKNLVTISAGAFQSKTFLNGVIIPASVISIGNYAFNGCSSLTNLIIEDGKTTLSLGYNDTGKGLFYDCPLETLYLGRDLIYNTSPFYGKKSLRQVTLANSVTTIGANAFSYSGLSSVEIPSSVTTIASDAFQNCSGLKEVHISDVAAWCNIIFSNQYSNPLYYAHHLFLNGEEVTDLVIPNSVTSISNYAFEGCSGLYSVFIPYSVTSIGSFVFNECNSLANLMIEDGETTLELGYNNYDNNGGTGEGLFYDCPLKTLYIGRNLSYRAHHQYGYSPFVRRYYSYLKDVTIGSSVTSVGAYAFRNCSLSSLTIKDGSGILNLSSNSFEGCSIGALYLGRNVSPSQYFANRSSLTSLTFGSFINSIEDGAFKNCSGLTSVVLPMGLTSVNESAFENCSALTSVTIPGGVRYIRSGAFKGCSSLESVNMINPIPAVIEEDSFDFQGTLYVPAESKMYYWIHPLWSKFPELEAWNVGSDVDFAENSVTYHITSEENATVEITAATLMARSVGELTIPEAIRFNDKMYTVTGIANNAFRDMMFESVELPQTIAYVGLNAFSGCTALKSLTVNALMPPSVARESFDDTVFASATLIVPEESREEYENDPVWGLFVSKDIAVGLDEIDAMSDGEIEVYDLKGVKIASGLKGLPKGIYIVRRGSRVSKISI